MRERLAFTLWSLAWSRPLGYRHPDRSRASRSPWRLSRTPAGRGRPAGRCLACRGDSGTDEFARNAAAACFQVHLGAARDITSAEISEALYVLADSGTVVLPRRRRTAGDCSMCTFRSSARTGSCPTSTSLFAALDSDHPSALAIVTGPSRSADIEQKLAVSVHSLGEVHVVVLPPAR